MKGNKSVNYSNIEQGLNILFPTVNVLVRLSIEVD